MKKKSIILIILLLPTIGIFPLSNGQQGETIVIEVNNNFFSPQQIQIEIGDTVIFEWDADATGHNVVQTDSSRSLSATSGGFSSGSPRNGPFTWELPQEYIPDNSTLFFICEPHASNDMRGSIIIGEGGSEEDASFMPLALILISFVMLPLVRKR